jgi:hypothetical protein
VCVWKTQLSTKVEAAGPGVIAGGPYVEWEQGIVRQLEKRVLAHLPAGKRGMLFTQLDGELWLRKQG